MSLVVTFLVILAALILIGWILGRRPQPRTEFERLMIHFTAAFNEIGLAIGEQLTPAMRQTAASFNDFAEALRKENE